MPCPVCSVTSFFGGWLGSYFGVNPPPNFSGKILSGFISATLTTITTVGLKSLLNLSFCAGSSSPLKNVVILGSLALSLGVAYSIGVNYLLNKFIYPSQPSQPPQPQSKSNPSNSSGKAASKMSDCCETT